jgi:hypothetical protein
MRSHRGGRMMGRREPVAAGSTVRPERGHRQKERSMDASPGTPSRLSRRSAVRGMGAAGAALAGVGLTGRAIAQEADAAAHHPLVGVWRVTAEPPGPSFGLAAYHGDGIMYFATPSPSPSPPGSPNALNHQIPAYGVWEATGARTAAMTGVHMDSDENGVFLDTLTFYATVEVDESGDTYALDAVFEIADPSGAVLVTAAASTRATRLRVQPAPALPESATPTA